MSLARSYNLGFLDAPEVWTGFGECRALKIVDANMFVRFDAAALGVSEFFVDAHDIEAGRNVVGWARSFLEIWRLCSCLYLWTS